MEKLSICVILAVQLINVANTKVRPPFYASEWATITAEDSSNHVLYFEHNLNAVPALVEVRVRAVDGDNEGYLFPGTSFSADDDQSVPRGGINYVYNVTHVIVFATKSTQNIGYGYVINTGISSNRLGPNVQFSKTGEVRVRVWSACDLPKPDFVSNWIHIRDNSGTSSFTEIDTNLDRYPRFLTLQIKLLEGEFTNYFIDGTGAAMINIQHVYKQHSGVLFAYNENKVRIWLPTNSYKLGKLFGLEDGFGYSSLYSSNTGEARVTTWTTSIPSPSVEGSGIVGIHNSDFQWSLDRDDYRDILINVEVMAHDGNNVGFRFRGTGAAQESSGTFGGLIYAYNGTYLRFWRPASETNTKGHIIDVGNYWGGGMYSDQIDNATFVYSLWEISNDIPDGYCGKEGCVLTTESFYCKCCAPSSDMCAGPLQTTAGVIAFSGYRLNAPLVHYSKVTLIQCITLCRTMEGNVGATFKNDTCSCFTGTDFSHGMTQDSDSDIWTILQPSP